MLSVMRLIKSEALFHHPDEFDSFNKLSSTMDKNSYKKDKSIKSPSNLSKLSSSRRWIKLFNLSSNKSQYKNFQCLFSQHIGSNESLIVNYSGALIRDILISCRMYISTNYLCFYGSLLKWETRIVISFSEISSIVKAKTIRVIPNAIQITTRSGQKYVFTSLISRNQVYSTLITTWTKARSNGLVIDCNNLDNSLIVEPLSAVTVKTATNSSNDPSIRKCYSDLESGSPLVVNQERITSNIVEDGNSVIDCQSRRKFFSTSDLIGCPDDVDSNNSVDSDLTVSDEPSKPLHDHTKCPYQGNRWSISDVVLPINPDRLFEMLFTQSKFMGDFAKSKKQAIQITQEWQAPHDSTQTESTGFVDKFTASRALIRSMVLDYSFAKKITSIEKWYLEEFDPSNRYNIKIKIESSGAPLTSMFYSINGFCIYKTDNPNESRFHFHYDIIFKSRAWAVKSFIEESSLRACRDYAESWTEAIIQWATNSPDYVTKPGLPDPLKMILSNNLSRSGVDSNYDSSSRLINSLDTQTPNQLPKTKDYRGSQIGSTQSSALQSKTMDQSFLPESLSKSSISSFQRSANHDNVTTCPNCLLLEKRITYSSSSEIAKHLKPLIVFLIFLTIVNLFLLVRQTNSISCLSSCSPSTSMMRMAVTDETFETMSACVRPTL